MPSRAFDRLGLLRELLHPLQRRRRQRIRWEVREGHGDDPPRYNPGPTFNPNRMPWGETIP